MNLEDELRSALRRVDPPAGFAERVLARARPRRPPYRLAAWAAAAALIVAGGLEYRRQAQGARARDRALLALDIASRELRAVQLKLEKVPAHERREP